VRNGRASKTGLVEGSVWIVLALIHIGITFNDVRFFRVIERVEQSAHSHLLRRGRLLEVITLGWNVIGVVVLAYAAIRARSVALAGFGLDSLIEIGASTVVLWELADIAQTRQRRALRMIGSAFVALSLYLAVQSTVILIVGYRPHHSSIGIAWTAATSVLMFVLARGKAKTGAMLGNSVLQAEGRVTMIDGILATAVLVALILNTFLGWWWADPVAGYVLLLYALREARSSLNH
jgi:divalent metal cation (Fe/Co/Zn/Cd) transporter